MSFVRQSRRLGDDLTDFVESGSWTNPDGSPTYNGGPYDPSDLMNPYNFGSAAAQPTTIALANTGIGTSPLTSLPPLVNYTPGGNAGTAISSSGLPPVATVAAPATNPLSGLTSIFTSISSIFTPKPAVALSPSGAPLVVSPATSSTIGGLSTSTLLLVGLLGVGAVILLKKKRAS